MLLTLILGLPLLIVFLFLCFGRLKRSKRLPPGPRGIPLIGNIAQIIVNPHLKLSQWTKEYGKLYTIKVGRIDALVVSDAKLMKTLFSHPASTGKFKSETFCMLSKGPYGVVNTEGTLWQEQRQFCVRTLVQHGLTNKDSMESQVLSEIQEIVDLWKEEMDKNNKVSVFETLDIATQNVIWTTITGERIGLQNPKISKIAGDFTKAAFYTAKSGLLFLPWLKYVAPKLSGYNELVETAAEFHEFFEESFRQHRIAQTPGSPRDVIDSYLDQMDKQEDNPSSTFHREIGLKNSIATIAELFIAGAETTSHTINWLILYLCDCPEVQAKLHEEIDKVVGHTRDPSLSDRKNMPYTEAVIQETLRKSSVGYIGVIHELLEDVEMFGYNLPKGLMLLANMYHVHHDQDVWGDPENFRPERFLVEEGSERKVIKSEHLVPFQIGKRECLGEPLAKDLLFLFVTKLFQTFQIMKDPDNPTLNWEADVGIFLCAQPYKVRIKVRG